MSEARRLATYNDILALPEGITGEIISGELHTQPRPAVRHGAVESALSSELGGPFSRGKGGPGGWIFVTEPELHLSGHVLVPDLAGWRRERAEGLLNQIHPSVVPDWICEILSPSTAAKDRTIKLPTYAALGIPYAWYIDPIARTLEAFKLMDGRWVVGTTAADDAKVRAEPFDAAEIELAALWGD
jgi:Uma2 family endonuclease